MSDHFLGEIRMFTTYWAPTGWALCDGQLMPISQNTALFALLGTIYGGDGKSTYALPDLAARSPLCTGQSPGTSYRDLGETGGAEHISLLQSEMPAHSHALNAIGEEANERQPPGQLPAIGSSIGMYDEAGGSAANMDPRAATPAGGSLPHNNMMPYVTVNFCIALQGVFPPRP